MKIDKSLRREKKQFRRKHGMRVSGRSTLVLANLKPAAVEKLELTEKQLSKIENTRRGGYLKEIPYPRIRRYPKYGKRTVYVKILYFSLGVHWHVDINEEDNYFLNTAVDEFNTKPYWHSTWDDKRGEGRHYTKKFNNPDDAKRWANDMIQKHFSNHKVIMTDSLKFWIQREGD